MPFQYRYIPFLENVGAGDKMDITIGLNVEGWKVLEFYSNRDDCAFRDDAAALYSSAGTIKVDEDDLKAGRYRSRLFDVLIKSTGNSLGLTPLTLTLSRLVAGRPVDLDPSDFDVKADNGALYNAIHIGNCGVTSCLPNSGIGNASIWVGSANGAAAGREAAAGMPEPASLALFGVGLAGLGLPLRRRRRAAEA